MLLLFVGFMRVLALQFGIVDWNLEYLGDGVHLGKAKIKPRGVFVEGFYCVFSVWRSECSFR